MIVSDRSFVFRFCAGVVAGMIACECWMVLMTKQTGVDVEGPRMRAIGELNNITVMSVETTATTNNDELTVDVVRMLHGSEREGVDDSLAVRDPHSLRFHDGQRLTCFPDVEHDWNRNPCGIIIDAVSMASRYRDDTAPYVSLVQRVISDVLMASSGHLPHFDPFPRLVFVDGWMTSEVIDHRALSQKGIVIHFLSLPLQRGRTGFSDDENRAGRSWWWGEAGRTFSKGARVLIFVVYNSSSTSSGGQSPSSQISSFDVARWTPFDRTLFVNASFGIPGRKGVAPPTLLLPLLDHFDFLGVSLPLGDVEMLKWQWSDHGSASSWSNPCAALFSPSLLLYNHSRSSQTATSTLLYAGKLFHTGMMLYRRSEDVSSMFARAANEEASISLLYESCLRKESNDELMLKGIALHRALTVTSEAYVSYSSVDSAHCVDSRFGRDLCHQLNTKKVPKKVREAEKRSVFRCDLFR